MKVLILGAAGMMGHKLMQTLSIKHKVTGTVRKQVLAYQHCKCLSITNLIGNIDVNNFKKLTKIVVQLEPQFIINCVGVIKQLKSAKDPVTAISINSLFPHKLASLCRNRKIRLIHISTDCVFSGDKGMYTESDISDATDLYGRSKYLGEVTGDHCLTIRTSIIGRELGSQSGLVEWFIKNSDSKIQGYSKAIYTGLTTIELSKVINKIIDDRPDLSGLWHISAEPINKYNLLCLLRDTLSLQTDITPVEKPKIDRSLDSTRFRKAMGYKPPDWPDMVDAMLEQGRLSI